MEVKVFDNDVEKALKILKNKLSKSGLFKELKLRRAYEKPSVKKKRKTIEARRRLAKVQRRRVFLTSVRRPQAVKREKGASVPQVKHLSSLRQTCFLRARS